MPNIVLDVNVYASLLLVIFFTALYLFMSLIQPSTILNNLMQFCCDPSMGRSTRLRHSGTNRLIILHCDEDLSVLQNLLTLTTHVIL